MAHRRWLRSPILLVSVVACSSGHVEWSTSSPESRGFDPAKLAAFSEQAAALNSASLLLARAGDIVLVVTREGMPLGYEVFPGNRVDVTTVEEIVKAMERASGSRIGSG